MPAFSATGGRAPPRRRRTGRPAGWTGDRKLVFLATLQSCLNVRRAAEAVGLTARSAYQLKQRDADFARDWAEALDIGYGELELELLRQSMHGSERIEIVRDGEAGTIRQIKTVLSFPHGMAMRLLLAHRDEVQRFRLASAQQQDDEAVGERVLAQMDLVRSRLLGAGAEAAAGAGAGMTESGEDGSERDDVG